MFIISQYLLNLSGTCKNINQISTYSIITGLILYASIYLYLLFYNDEYLSIFNKFLIYVIIVDLLLSTFYYFNLQKSFKYDSIDIDEYKKLHAHEIDLESVDMSLVDDDISDTQSEEQETEQETDEELEETELEETELEETELEEIKEEIKEEIEKEIKQEIKKEIKEEIDQEIQNNTEQEFQQDTQLDLDLDEIDTLLSIPVLEEVVEPKKIKAKRQPRKKKENVE
jgi:hypothetical protein